LCSKQNNMSHLSIQFTGVGAELVLGNYKPEDTTIFNDWQEFFNYNDLIHESQLLTEHISELLITRDEEIVFQGRIPSPQIQAQKSFSPALVPQALYLRTECAENAIYRCELDTEEFDISKLSFETQDYDLLFKVGKSFLSRLLYDGNELKPEWVSAVPVGNICVLCRAENGCLVPVYNAVGKVYSL